MGASQGSKAEGSGIHRSKELAMTDVDITYVNGYFRVKIKGHAGYGKANGFPEGRTLCVRLCLSLDRH